MSNLDEIGKLPEQMKSAEQKPKGINLFFGSAENIFFTSVGSEITQAILQESFLLFQIDMQKTQQDWYGQAKKKVYKEPVEIFARINVTAESPTYYTQGNIEKKGMGKLSASLYLDQLELLGLITKQIGTNSIVYAIKMGHYIGYKGQFYRIIDDGYSQISNEYSYAGDRRFAISISALEVDEDEFNGR